MTPAHRPLRALFAAMLLAGMTVLSACGVMAGTGRGVSTAGGAMTDTATATQQKIHDVTGAAKQ